MRLRCRHEVALNLSAVEVVYLQLLSAFSLPACPPPSLPPSLPQYLPPLTFPPPAPSPPLRVIAIQLCDLDVASKVDMLRNIKLDGRNIISCKTSNWPDG